MRVRCSLRCESRANAGLAGSTLIIVVAVAISCATPPAPAQQPTPADIERLKLGSILTWSPSDQRLGYPNIEKIAPTARVRRSSTPLPLTTALRDLSKFRYTHADRARTIEESMSALNVVGIIAVRDDAILFERYAEGHDRETPWTAFSVVKSMTSLLYGAALENGHIRSLDELVTAHLPELTGSAYDGVTLRHLLQMASGVTWNPNMADKTSDTYQLPGVERSGGFKALLTFMAAKPRAAPPGQKFIYNTAEADLAGAVLMRATRRSLADYLTENIWQPFGMESDAHWLTIAGGDIEHGDCCLSMTLRDYARVGLFALRDGTARDGVRRLPEGWMAESTRPSAAFPGYGYYWWLRKGGGYFASGSFGQHIEVDPATRTVVAIQSYWPVAYSDELISHNDTFVAALIAALR
jgi:CubicO group peptidase (beta-lactamase class C family)